MKWIVVVNQSDKAGDITQLSAFGPPMEESEALDLMNDISWGNDVDESREPYNVSWVAVVPLHHEEGFDSTLAATTKKDPAMRTLSIVPQPAPASAPGLNMNGTVKTTALMTPKRGDDFYLCNPMDEIIAARASGEPFVVHQVVGMRPKRVIIEPGTIARIREV